MSTVLVGLDVKFRFSDDVLAWPSVVFRSSGTIGSVVFTVNGSSGSPASRRLATDAYTLARDLYGSLYDTKPLTPMNELSGASAVRPCDPADVLSIARHGLS